MSLQDILERRWMKTQKAWTQRFCHQAQIDHVQRSHQELLKRGYTDLYRGHPPEAYPPQWGDLWRLYQAVARVRPQLILEFGSGCSTLLLAQAQADLVPTGQLYSVEAEAKWTEVTLARLPQALQLQAQVVHHPLAPVTVHGVQGYRHTNLPQLTPQLIFLDGPDFTPGRQVAVDLLDIEPRLQPGCTLLIDGRWTNTRFLKRHFTRRWTWTHGYVENMNQAILQ